MRKWIKIILVILSIPVILIVSFSAWYLISNWQGVIDPFAKGDPGADYKILMASQGSDFKRLLVDKIVDRVSDDSVYVSVMDCTTLEDEEVETWDAVVIIHTTQIHGMPETARSYLNRFEDMSNVLLVTTSGGGDEVVTEFDVDALSCASHLSLTDTITEWTVVRLENILERKFLQE